VPTQSTTEIIELPDAIDWVIDKAECPVTEVSIVSDAEGFDGSN